MIVQLGAAEPEVPADTLTAVHHALLLECLGDWDWDWPSWDMALPVA